MGAELLILAFVVGIGTAIAVRIYTAKATKKKEVTRTPHPIRLTQRFFGKYESKLYTTLKEIIDNTEGVELFAKVRWEDIWNELGGETRIQYRGFLKSRRVDFVIVKGNTPYLIVEIKEGRNKEREERIREFCEDTNLHLLFVQPKEQYETEEIKKGLRDCLEQKEMVLEI